MFLVTMIIGAARDGSLLLFFENQNTKYMNKKSILLLTAAILCEMSYITEHMTSLYFNLSAFILACLLACTYHYEECKR